MSTFSYDYRQTKPNSILKIIQKVTTCPNFSLDFSPRSARVSCCISTSKSMTSCQERINTGIEKHNAVVDLTARAAITLLKMQLGVLQEAVNFLSFQLEVITFTTTYLPTTDCGIPLPPQNPTRLPPHRLPLPLPHSQSEPGAGRNGRARSGAAAAVAAPRRPRSPRPAAAGVTLGSSPRRSDPQAEGAGGWVGAQPGTA